MAEETAAPEPGTDDADLEKAWQQEQGLSAPEENPEETPPAATPPEEPPADEPPSDDDEPKPGADEPPTDDKTPEQRHRERSDLGRKLKSFQEQVSTWQEQLQAEIDALKGKAPAVDDEPQGYEPKPVTTATDVEAVIAERERKASLQQAEYQQKYLDSFTMLSETDPDLRDEVWARITENNLQNEFNRVVTGQPEIDAQLNFANAKMAVLQDKLKSGKSPLPKREAADTPPGQPAAITARAPQQVKEMPKFDPMTDDYIKYLRSKDVPDEEILSLLQ